MADTWASLLSSGDACASSGVCPRQAAAPEKWQANDDCATEPDAVAAGSESEEVQALRRALVSCQDELEHTRHLIATQADLHLFSPLITRYYTEIYKRVRGDFQGRSDGFTSFPYSSWVELFSAASSETERFNDFSVDKRPLTRTILRYMRASGGITEEDWDILQELRQRRNQLSHPLATVETVRRAVSARWRDHEAGRVLTKMTQALERGDGRTHGELRVRSRK